MEDGRRDELRRKYLSLGVGELFAVGVFVVVANQTVLPRLAGSERLALWAALIPLLIVLTQAGVYWLLARGWVPDGDMPTSLAFVFRVFRGVDLAVLVIGLAGVIVWWPDRSGAAVVVGAIWLFAVIEYVNYFVARLSYPVHRWTAEVRHWRTPRLVKDMVADCADPRTLRPR